MATTITTAIPLSARQQKIYDFIKKKIANGMVPTVREIGAAMNIKSPNGVVCHLNALEKKGYIRRAANLSRAIELTEKAPRETALPFRGDLVRNRKLKAPSEHEEIDFLDILGSGDYFCFRAADDSMAEDGIAKNDLLICREQQSYRDGDRVIVQLTKDQVLLKRFFQEANGIRLEPTTTSKNPIRTTDATILGMVVGMIRPR